MATHTVIEIPKTTSGPADPRAPSILTTLPPEIRNRIYEYLFKRYRPVILDDEEEDFCDVFAGCTDLLLSCRQVYHEAVGILYGQNTFFVTPFLEDQMQFTCTWLSRIGSHYHLLSRVSMDADALPPATYRRYDLLPLLKFIWGYPQAKCEFAFVVSRNSGFKEQNNGAEPYDSITAADIMNTILFGLGTADVLNLKQYARYSGLISSVMVWYHDHAQCGYVEYNDSRIPRSFPHPDRGFSILDHGSKIQWKEPEQLDLVSLPGECLSTINAYARASDTDVAFDLDASEARGYRIGLSGVDTSLRLDIDQMHTRVYDEIIIRMSTQEARTDFDDFKALQKLLEVDNFESLVNPHHCREEQCFINMVLMFKLSTPEPTADFRININKLLHIFKHDHGCLLITVQESDSSMNGTQSIKWHLIQRAVFLLLSDVLEQYPSKADQPLPQIWIDGHGTALCATYPAMATSEETTIPCSYAIDDPADVLEQYRRKIIHLDQSGMWEQCVSPLDIYSQMNNDSLASMCYCIRYYLGIN